MLLRRGSLESATSLYGPCLWVRKNNEMPCDGLQNQFDSIDFSDNNIMILEGFSRLPRLQTLYLNNNRIIRIGKNLHGIEYSLPPLVADPHCKLACHEVQCCAESIPALSTLILTNNRIKNLQVSSLHRCSDERMLMGFGQTWSLIL